MSEVASRPAASRGRGTTRGRGGFRGSTRARQTNGDAADDRLDEADQGLADLKKQYGGQLKSLKELFADWADVDLLLALQETDGDLERTIDHISEGNVAQFSDVKKKAKDRSRSKVDTQPETSGRPTRGRGNLESGRGGRGRSERGRGAPRAGRGGQATTESRGAANDASVPTTESGAWGDKSALGVGTIAKTASKATVQDPKPAAPIAVAAAPPPPQKTWASMFAPKKPLVEASKPKSAAEPPRAQEPGAVPSSDISSGYVEVTHSDADPEPEPQRGASITSQPASEVLDAPTIEIDDTNLTLPPPKDKLTEDNVENLPDVSQPAPVGTAASEVESSRGPDSTSISVVAAPTQPIPIGRPGLGGFATSALKATTPTGRSASFQRRILEQQEAVVMPGNHAVDRAAVQFGSLGLNGDSEALNVDEDREELETRAQPPQHSPVAQPKTSLPPAARVEAAAQEQVTVKPAPGLPHPSAQQAAAQHTGTSQVGQTAQAQAGHGYNQFGRYGQTQDATSQKQHYDPFGQQQSQQSQYDAYGSSSQAPSQPQQNATSQGAGYQSGSNDYYSSEQQRNAYQNYYGNYGQQDAGAGQQRSGSAFGAGNESSYGSAQAQQQSQSRFGENQSTSASSTSATGQQQGSTGQPQQAHHGHGQQQGYSYNHPYYNQPYYTAYMNQYQGYGQQGFGAPFGKGGMYGHPQHGYGMPQSGYDQHSSTPAQSGSFGREGASSTLNSDYTRSGSTQPGQSQSSATGGYTSDAFGRSPSAYSGQGGQYGQQAASQQSGNDDSLKPYGEKSTGAGNAASLGQPGRPTSANQTGQGLPPPQSQQGYGGYGNQYQGGQSQQYGGGLGGLGAQGGQSQQHGYGSYSNYQNSYGQYGQGQQRGNSGWSGQNYGH